MKKKVLNILLIMLFAILFIVAYSSFRVVHVGEAIDLEEQLDYYWDQYGKEFYNLNELDKILNK